MNRQKQKELDRNLEYMKSRFQEIDDPNYLPQNISGERLRCRLAHTASQPKPVSFFRRQRIGQFAAMACTLVLVAVLARYSAVAARPEPQMMSELPPAAARDISVQEISAEQEKPQPEPEKEHTAKRTSRRVEVFAMEDVVETAAEKIPAQEDKKPAPFFESEPDSENAVVFSDDEAYSSVEQIRDELMQKDEKEEKEHSSAVVFGGDNPYSMVKNRMGKVVELIDHVLYFGIDPETSEEVNSLFVVSSDNENEIEKEVILPEPSLAEVRMLVSPDEEHIVLMAQRRDSVSLMTLSLSDYSTAQFRMAGKGLDCWMNGNYLYASSRMDVAEDAVLSGEEFLPYAGVENEKQSLAPGRIYRLEDGQPPEQFTTVAMMDISEGTIEAISVLGGETDVRVGKKSIILTSAEDPDMKLKFSNTTLLRE